MLTSARLLQLWCQEFEETIGAMTAAVPAGRGDGISDAPDLWWGIEFTSESASGLCAGADGPTWSAVAGAVLRTAGIVRPETEELRSTWFSLLRQVSDRAAAQFSEETGIVNCSGGEKSAGPPGGALRQEIRMRMGDGVLRVSVAAWDVPQAASESPRTLEALMNVSLPISICFGRTRMPLRETVKLTSGSVIVLDKSATDPVEIVVNDSVIATGEIVVVDGNYAVRLQSIAGRRQRMGLGPQTGGSLP